MLTYRGFLSLKSGYAMASMMDCLALDRVNAPFKCASLVRSHRPVIGLFGESDEVVARHVDPSCWDAPGTQIIRCIPTDAIAPMLNARSDQGFPVHLGPDQKRICATVFETPNWPVGWVTAANSYDALILPAQWLKESAEFAGVKSPIFVVPHALDFPEVAPARELNIPAEYWFGPSSADVAHTGRSPREMPPYRVLFEGTYMLRKNIPAAVEAFWRAFEPGEAEMLVHTHFFHPDHRAFLMRELWERKEKFSPRTLPLVRVSDCPLGWNDLWGMYSWCASAPAKGIYISMAYAEGVGYPLLMAAGLGIDVVCTDFVGHRATVPFAQMVNSTPTNPGKLRPFDPMDRSFRIAHIYDEDQWMRPDPEHAAGILKAIAEEKKALPVTGELLSASIRAKHDPKTVGQQLVDVVNAVNAG